MKNELTIYGLNENIAYCEAMGLSKCFEAYANIGEDILELGFNTNSGYVYIALENGVSICSMLGQDVEYLVTDFESGEELFFDTYEEAENHFHTLNA
jgi:virulence-associated protein VapD